MDTMRLVFSLLVVSITVSSVHALEWVEYEGTIPENAVSVNEGTEDRPVCRKNSRIGIVNDAGKCYSVKVGGGVSKKTEDDGYQILVDNSETEIELAVAAATEGMYTEEEYLAAVTEDANAEYCGPSIDSSFGLMNPADCRVADGYVGIVSGNSSWVEGSFKYADIRGTDGNGNPRYCKMDRQKQ